MMGLVPLQEETPDGLLSLSFSPPFEDTARRQLSTSQEEPEPTILAP